MKAHIWNIGKAKFERIPESERTLILGLGHIGNEINVLQKLLYWASPSEDEPELLRRAHSSQALTIARLLAGKLAETWRFLEKALFANRLSVEYEAAVSEDGRRSLNKLKKYFGRANAVTTVRNEFAFHYSVDQIRDGFALPEDSNEWQIVLSEANGNNLYYVADLVASYSMLNRIDSTDHWNAIDRLLRELIDLAQLVMTFRDACWIVVGDKYLREQGYGIPVQEVEIEDCPRIDEVEVPFFIEPPRA